MKSPVTPPRPPAGPTATSFTKQPNNENREKRPGACENGVGQSGAPSEVRTPAKYPPLAPPAERGDSA